MKKKYKFYKIADKILRVVYPAQCPICGEKVSYREGTVHTQCKNGLPYINGARCRKCSKEISDIREEYCYDCQKTKHIYRKGIALFKHTGAIKNAVYAVKYNNKREYLDLFADELINEYKDIIMQWDADILVPVPLHKKKEIKRGFNQAEEFAKRIGMRIGMKMETKAIARVRNTVPQKELSDKERKKNLEKAFKVNKNIVKSKKIIVVDDIYTTGSTIDACAKALIENEAEEVYFITITIGNGI